MGIENVSAQERVTNPEDLGIIQRQIMNRTEEVIQGNLEQELIRTLEGLNPHLARETLLALAERSGAAHQALRDLGLDESTAAENFSSH